MLYLHYGGQTHGPYMLDQIRSMWGSGVVTADAVYWNEAASAWEPIHKLLNPDRSSDTEPKRKRPAEHREAEPKQGAGDAAQKANPRKSAAEAPIAMAVSSAGDEPPALRALLEPPPLPREGESIPAQTPGPGAPRPPFYARPLSPIAILGYTLLLVVVIPVLIRAGFSVTTAGDSPTQKGPEESPNSIANHTPAPTPPPPVQTPAESSTVSESAHKTMLEAAGKKYPDLRDSNSAMFTLCRDIASKARTDEHDPLHSKVNSVEFPMFVADEAAKRLGIKPGTVGTTNSAPTSRNKSPIARAEPTGTASTPKPMASVADLTKECSKYLLIVEGNSGKGSASIINFSGTPILITNGHVISGNQSVSFKFLNGQELTMDALSVPRDERDIVAAKQTILSTGLPASASVDTDVSIGDDVIVLGNSEGSGVVTQIRGKVLGIGPDLIETDAPFVHGNSGGPIIHVKTGKVIGIASFAQIRALDNVNRNTRFGEIRRFGLRIDSIRGWDDVSYSEFLQEGLFLASVERRDQDLWTLSRELIAKKRVTLSKYDPRSWTGSYLDRLAICAARNDAVGCWRTVDEFRARLNDDISDGRINALHAYHQKKAEQEIKNRHVLFNYFYAFDWHDVKFDDDR